MNMTPEQLRAQGWVEQNPGQWVKVSNSPNVPLKNLGAGGGVDSRRHAGAKAEIGCREPDRADSPVRTSQASPSGSSAPPARTVKRLRQSSKPLLNKLETEFKQYHEARTGHVLIPQSIRFRLGNGIWFKPDFVLFDATMGVKAFETKGPHAFRGGFENLKVAASLYPQIKWILVWKTDGQWQEQEILA